MKFETEYFHIDEHGIDLKKNMIKFKHIDYSEIDEISIFKGFLINNRALTISIGILTILGSLLWIKMIFIESHFQFSVRIIYNRVFWLLSASPWMLLLFGIYLTITGFKKSLRLKIKLKDGGHHSQEISKIAKNESELKKLIQFLCLRVPLRQYN